MKKQANGSDYDKGQMAEIKNQIMLNEHDAELEAKGGIDPAIRHMYRNVLLNSPDGRKVLAHLLNEMGYGRKISHPQEIGIHNIAQGILDILGVGSQDMLEEALAQWAIMPPED